MEPVENFINNVVRHMETELTVRQLQKLKIVLTMDVSKFRIEESKNDVVIYDESSDLAAYKQYFVSMKLRGLADGTINLAMRTVDRFNRYMRKPFKEVTTNDIRLYIASRDMEHHLSKATLNRERGAICRFYSWLFEEEYIPKNPAKRVEAIKVEKRLKKAFTPIEVELMRNACIKPKEKAVFELLLSTGCRVTELTLLSMENYDQQSGSITVIGKGNKERRVFVNARAKVAIDNYLKIKPHTMGPIICGLHGIGTGMTPNGIQKMVKEIAKRAGVAHAHPHKFRRTAATFAIKQGMEINNVRIFLGHSSISTTQGYIDVSGMDFKQIHERFIA
ncbi:tyrosine-type recombinase/integrase [Enterococcus avium]|uniref:tyrosine-type recombinase/integrase n=1 Tax=Enterococcus avium TaxID=33945 RepID=UPI00288F64B9|nr:tyrosine-type recombinase/integrase [Enterococcus avium]MDT2469822.1 tyrosine-type recombinase/integrase [Enterococcus avium]